MPSRPAGTPRRWRDGLTLLLIVGLLGAAYLLPPDTSLSEVRKAGLLRVCVPVSYPPLVTGDPQAPGIDIELLQAVADDLGVRLSINANPAIGQDFNPRNWRISRAQCQLLAGGVVASDLTRSFLETAYPHGETGWVAIYPTPPETLQGRTTGVFTGISGLDRIALSRYLRSQGAEVEVFRSAADLAAALDAGTVEVGVSEALLARQIASEHDWSVAWLPAELGRYGLVFGLWKGDLTLKRALTRSLERLERRGVVAAIEEKYL